MIKKFPIYILFFVSFGLNCADQQSRSLTPTDRSNEHISDPSLPISIKEQIKDIKDMKKGKKGDTKIVFTFGPEGKNKLGFSIRNRTEAFYSRSAQLLSPNPLDQTIYAQYTWDLKVDTAIGQALKALIVLRHKGRWGNPNTIARTTENTVKIADDVTGSHKHFLGKQIIWMREGWVDISLNDAFCLNFKNRHYLTMGAFSFRLGRGIALGDAYAASPGLLGFYSNNVVDQYAPAILFHGDLEKGKVNYDVYLALLENLSDSFDNVNEEIYAMETGRRKCPQRGFGKLNYVLASRLNVNLLPDDCGRKLGLEPYIMYNFNPEQDLDFPSDASSHLVTFGCAMEYEGPKWEFGFDFAQNFGRQSVRAWDKNHLLSTRNPDNAAINLVYTQVFTSDPNTNPKAKRALVTDENKKIVNSAPQGPEFNGKEIGDSGLFNGKHRFRKCYNNDYGGWMFVTDAAYKVCDGFKVVATAGVGSGDEDPNVDLRDPLESEVDGEYGGFIGLQEIYSGKRVPSVFLLGANAIPRPLSVPSNEIPEDDRFAQNALGFTNIVFLGGGLDWGFVQWSKKFNFRPNVIAYWQENPTNKFSLKLKRPLPEQASSYLGLELNLFSDVNLLDDLKAFFVAGVFLPGQHFKDVTGVPLNRKQVQEIKEVNDTGFNRARMPFLAHHTVVVLNWGFELVF